MKKFFPRFFDRQKPREFSIKDGSMTPNEPYGCDIDPLIFPDKNEPAKPIETAQKKD